MNSTYVVSQRRHPKEPVPSSVLDFVNADEPVNPVRITSPNIIDNLEFSFHLAKHWIRLAGIGPGWNDSLQQASCCRALPGSQVDSKGFPPV